MKTDYKTRQKKVLALLKDRGISAALITEPLSIFYLSGYYTEPYERFLGLLLTGDAESTHTTLFCNRLFPSAEGKAEHIVEFDDTEDPLPLLIEAAKGESLGVDKELPARWLLPLMEHADVKVVGLASFAVDAVRSIKDAAEQELMRQTSLTNDRAMDWLVAQLKPGVTEQEIAEGLLSEYRRLGAEDHSFSPIVSFGANAADPHHEPDGTTFKLGDMVLFDVGCKQNSYCSDMTRTFFTKEPTERERLIYETVRRANEEAEKLVAPGVMFSDIDLCARKIIEDAGFGPYFNHRLGHQIGLVDHEPGDVSATHHEAVVPGQCFSIEPGIYLLGEIGVRIEDLLIVTNDGAEILNHYSKELTVLTI